MEKVKSACFLEGPVWPRYDSLDPVRKENHRNRPSQCLRINAIEQGRNGSMTRVLEYLELFTYKSGLCAIQREASGHVCVSHHIVVVGFAFYHFEVLYMASRWAFRDTIRCSRCAWETTLRDGERLGNGKVRCDRRGRISY